MLLWCNAQRLFLGPWFQLVLAACTRPLTVMLSSNVEKNPNMLQKKHTISHTHAHMLSFKSRTHTHSHNHTLYNNTCASKDKLSFWLYANAHQQHTTQPHCASSLSLLLASRLSPSCSITTCESANNARIVFQDPQAQSHAVLSTKQHTPTHPTHKYIHTVYSLAHLRAHSSQW